MREFFVDLLKNLKNLTGILQYEKIASLPTVSEAQKALDDLIMPMVKVCDSFGYIPDEDKMRIIPKKIIEDTEFTGLNAKKIWLYLNSVSERYFTESHHVEVNKIEQVELKPLSPETEKLIADFQARLLTGIGDMEITNIESEKKKIEFEEQNKQKRVALSAGRSNQITLAKYKLLEAIKRARFDFYGDIRTATDKWDYFDVEGESIFCASQEDAFEIYTNAISTL